MEEVADIRYKSWSLAGIVQSPKLLQELIKLKPDIRIDVDNSYKNGEELLQRVTKPYFRGEFPSQITFNAFEQSELELKITTEKRSDDDLTIDDDKVYAFIEPIKFDKTAKLNKEQRKELRERFYLKDNSFVLVAGSVRKNDELNLMRAIKSAIDPIAEQGRYLEAIIVPRELSFGEELKRDTGYSEEFRKRLRIVNSEGELPHLYSIADVAYIGGTWGEDMGQNPLEAAFYAKRIIAGPSYENNKEIYNTLICTGMLKQANTSLKLARLIYEQPAQDELNEIMLRTGVWIDQHRGASEAYAKKIIDKLDDVKRLRSSQQLGLDL